MPLSRLTSPLSRLGRRCSISLPRPPLTGRRWATQCEINPPATEAVERTEIKTAWYVVASVSSTTRWHTILVGQRQAGRGLEWSPQATVRRPPCQPGQDGCLAVHGHHVPLTSRFFYKPQWRTTRLKVEDHCNWTGVVWFFHETRAHIPGRWRRRSRK